MKRNIQWIRYETVKQYNMNQLRPSTMPTTLTWNDNNILLARLLFLIIFLFSTPSFVECTTALILVAIHVFLSHFIFIVQESDQKVSFLSHSSNMLSKQTPILSGSLFSVLC